MADRRCCADLDAAHEAFLDALGDVDAELVTVPGVMEDWSVRDLVVHVAVWCEHGADALELATSGRGAEFGYSKAETDAMNERILAEAARPRPRLPSRARSGLRGLPRAHRRDSPEALATVLGNGDTVEEVILYDGPEHYAEHTAHLRAWFVTEPDED